MFNLFNQFIGNLRLAQKFTLIAMPIALSLAVLFYMFIQQQRALIATTEQELQGVAQLPALFGLLDNVQKHRGTSQIAKGGAAGSQEQLEALNTQINQSLEALKKSIPAEWITTHERLQSIQNEWSDIKASNAGWTPAQSFAAHSKLIGHVIDLIRFSADDSTMTFDPEVASYYLISALNFELPALIEQVAVLRGKLSNMATQQTENARVLGEAHTRISLALQSASNLESSYAKVVAAGYPLGPEFQTFFAQLREDMATLDTLVNSMETDLSRHSGPKVFQQITNYMNNLFALKSKSVEQLDLALNQRIDREHRLIATRLAFAFFILALAIGLGIFAFRKINSDLKILLDQAKRVANFDLSDQGALNSRDEMGIISKSIDSVRSNQAKAVNEMSALTTRLTESTQLLSSATQQIAQGSEEQSDASSTVAAAVEELSVSVGQVTEHANATHGLAKKTEQSSREGLEKVEATRHAMIDIGQASEKLAGTMENLGQRSESISSIVQTIHEIAEQTNLLALNAAIEAARAGEQGRGFAVVADEVRKLSERTAVSTQSISDLVRDIQQDTQSAVDNVRGWKDRIGTGVAVSDEAQSRMQAISQDSVSTENAILEINQALGEQSEASQMIARQIEKIAQMTEESQSAVVSVRDVAEEVRHSSDKLKTLVDAYKLA